MKITDIADVYKHINNWKRLFIFLLFSFSLFILFSLFENKDKIYKLILLNSLETKIDLNKVDMLSSKITSDINAQSVIVWSVDVKRNIIESVYVKKNKSREGFSEGKGDALFRANGVGSKNIVEIMNNESFCYDVSEGFYLEGDIFGDDISYICSSAIPPSFGDIVGIVSVGFKKKQSRDDYIRLKVKEFASKSTNKDSDL